MDYNIINSQIVINAIGFKDKAYIFEEFLRKNDIIGKYSLEKKEVTVNFPENFPMEQKDRFFNNLPIRKFMNQDVYIGYSEPEHLLSFQLLKSGNEQIIKDIALDILVQYNTGLEKIGLNFSKTIDYNTTKLNLLNNNLTNMDIWKKNITFELTIPFNFGNYVGTYTIQKLVPINSDNKKHVYKIDANFEFDISMLVGYAKYENIESILKGINENYKQEFDDTCNKFLGLKI